MKNILLVADAGGEIGWGHAMRTLAVAEALVEMGQACVRWMTTTPEAIRGLNPLCPVAMWPGPYAWASGLFVDGLKMKENEEPREETWIVVDNGNGREGYNRICPHFGAEKRDWGSGMVATGPMWMPLRHELAFQPSLYDTGGKILSYRVNLAALIKDVYPTEVIGLEELGGRSWWLEGPYRYAIVPPSVIAYECMVLGIPVYLVPLEGQSTEIGDAMVDLGVAFWYREDEKSGPNSVRDAMAKHARSLVDGRGAERVANLLLGG
jgi:hypothetical protein